MGAAADTESGQQPPSDQELWDVVGKLELPMLLIDLKDLTVSAISTARCSFPAKRPLTPVSIGRGCSTTKPRTVHIFGWMSVGSLRRA